jgi:hypothetical protein
LCAVRKIYALRHVVVPLPALWSGTLNYFNKIPIAMGFSVLGAFFSQD